MAQPDDPTTQLRSAETNGGLVRVKRSIRRADELDGYPVGVGKKWFLLHVMNPEMFLNGYTALRIRDVKRVRRLADDGFPAQALSLAGETREVPEGVDLASTKALLLTAAASFRLVTIHIEEVDPSVCFVGSPASASEKKLRLLEISPGAEWDRKPTVWALRSISRVDFGGRYKTALQAVGGEAPGNA